MLCYVVMITVNAGCCGFGLSQRASAAAEGRVSVWFVVLLFTTVICTFFYSTHMIFLFFVCHDGALSYRTPLAATTNSPDLTAQE